jgi:uncharacterized repeat protein (TIGR02543 family)
MLVLALLLSLCPMLGPSGEAADGEYLVQFFSDGISSEPVQTQTVTDGTTAVNPGPAVIDPTHIPISLMGKYLSFLGWYEKGASDDEPYDFNRPVTGPLDLYARFTTELLISYLDGDGKVFLSKRIDAGKTIPIPSDDEMQLLKAPSKKKFELWRLNGAVYDKDNLRNARTDATLVPEFEDRSEFYVFFVSEGTQTPFDFVANGAKAERPPDPTRQGYTFSHWSEDGKSVFDFNKPIGNDTTLHAVWTPNTVPYTVVFWYEKPNIVDGSGEPVDPGEKADNYDYYFQFSESAPAGTSTDNITNAANVDALIKARTANTPPYSEFRHASSGADTVLGNGSTVVNIYFKRNVYNFTFDLDYAISASREFPKEDRRNDSTLTIKGKTYNSGKYIYSAKYEQDISEIWPGNSRSVTTAATSRYCTGWYALGYSTPFVSKVLTVSEDMLPKTGPNQTVTARWSGSAHPVSLHYMFEYMDGDETLTADITKYNNKSYAQSKLYSQELLSAGTNPFNLKSINGMTALTAQALKKSGGNYVAATGSPADQYLFYDRKTYKLEFNAQGGTARANAGKDYKAIKYGEPLAAYEPDDPVYEKDGVKYVFEGWYYDADGLRPFNFDGAKMPSADLLLFAKWSSAQYTVSVYDGLVQGRLLLTFGRGLNEYIGDPTQEFEKLKDAPGTQTDRDKIKNPATAADGDFPGKGQFIDWVVCAGPEKTVPLSYETPVTQDISIYADWYKLPESYTISYDDAEGTEAPTDKNSYSGGAQARVLAAAKPPADKHFIGWFDQSIEKLYNHGALITVDRDIALTAQFAEDSAAVEILYHNNNPAGNDAPALPQYAKKGSTVTLYNASIFDNPSRADWRFVNWSVNAEGKADGTDGKDLYAENAAFAVLEEAGKKIELYAIWEKVERHIVRFDAGEHGTFPAGAKTLFAVEDGKTLAESIPTVGDLASPGYMFIGWRQPLSLSLESPNDVVILADTVFVAQYAQTQKELRFHANYTPNMLAIAGYGEESDKPTLEEQVTVDIENPTDIENSKQTYTMPDFTAAGIFEDVTKPEYYYFKGWSETQNDKAAAYNVGYLLPITDTADRDFYAVWDRPVHKVTFDAGEHGKIWSNYKTEFSVSEGMSFTSIGAIAPTDAVTAESTWQFIGWSNAYASDPTALVIFDPDAAVTAGAAYTARYKQPTNTIVYHANRPNMSDPVTASATHLLRDEFVTLPDIKVFDGAISEPATYTFVGWGESADPISSAKYLSGEKLLMTDNPDKNNQDDDPYIINLYAKWKANNQYTVRFLLNDDDGSHGAFWEDDTPTIYAVTGGAIIKNAVVTPPSVIALFSYFTGWKDQGSQAYNDEQTVSGDITYKAQYETGKLDVIYHANLGEDSPGDNTIPLLKEGTALPIMSFEEAFGAAALPDDKVFLGWGPFKDQPSLRYEPDSYLLITHWVASPGGQSMDLYAFWKDVPNYTVEFKQGEHGVFPEGEGKEADSKTQNEGPGTISYNTISYNKVRQGTALKYAPPTPTPSAPNYAFVGWSPRFDPNEPVLGDVTYEAIYQNTPLRFAPEEKSPPAGDPNTDPGAESPPGPYEVKVLNYDAPYDAEEHTIYIAFGDEIAKLNPKVYYSNPATPKTVNWMSAKNENERVKAYASVTRLYAAASDQEEGFEETALGFRLPALRDAYTYELPLYFTADGFAGAGIIRYIKVSPLTVDAGATHEDIYVGDPVPDPSEYAVSLTGAKGYEAEFEAIQRDYRLNVNELELSTNYNQGDPVGQYNIYVKSGRPDNESGRPGNYIIEKSYEDTVVVGTFNVVKKVEEEDEKENGTNTQFTGGGGATPPPTSSELNRDDHYAYIVGYPDGLVHPERNITREEAATIFFRLLTEESRDAHRSAANPYPDVDAARWSNEEISTLSKAGILTGYPDGSFKPAAPVTRAEFTAIAARFDGGSKTAENNFNDTAEHWARSLIDRACALGWVTGYEDGSFRPDRDITRAEAATLINRALERRVESADDLLPDMRVWPDNADTAAWYYFDIQEASNSHNYERKADSVAEIWTSIIETPTWD